MRTVSDLSLGQKEARGQQKTGVGCDRNTGKGRETKDNVKVALESRTVRHCTKSSPEGIGDRQTPGVGCVCKGTKMAPEGSIKTPRKSPTETVKDMTIGGKCTGGQQTPGVWCIHKTSSYGKTEAAVKTASESRIARQDAEISPEGTEDRKNPGVGRVCKGAKMANGESDKPPRGKPLGTKKD